MSISVKVDEQAKIIKISLLGSFDFSLFNEFRAAYLDYAENYGHFVIDMELVDYLDSAALGMLLSMRNSVGEDSRIELINANDFIKNILMISRFNKRFTIA